jgi:hypothetical protein
MPFARSEVRVHNGVPTIFADGQPMHGMTATSCAFGDPKVIQDFTKSGVEIMMIWIEAGIPCWKGPGQYDWTYAEDKLKLFEANSGDTKWIIRVRLGLLARWWAHAHPTEVHNPPGTEAGKPDPGLSVCNLTSPVWRDDVCTLLNAFVTWLKGTRWASRIIGFMLNAGSTEEWLIFDTGETTKGNYHPVYTREFRLWLRRKYGDDVGALRAAWSGLDPGHNILDKKDPADQGVTFDNATCPGGHIRKGSHIWGPYSLRDPREDQAAIDYYHFLNETLADHLIAFCRAAKEAAGTPIICGGFHSYLWWETGVYSYIQEYGHGLIQRLNDSPWIDFVSDITTYDVRYAGAPSNYLGLPQCLNVHGKLHYTEVDLCTVSNLPAEWRKAWKAADTSRIPVKSSEPVIPNRVWNWNNNYCGRDEAEQIAIFQREHLHNLITGTPYWWFDIRSHNYQEPWMIETLKRLSDLGKQAVNWDRRTNCDVAFVCSEETPMYQAAMNGEMVRFELESVHTLLLDLCTRRWGVAGVPFDIYELHDLAHPNFPGDQYKMIVFVNCAKVSEKAAAGIRRWQQGGRTMLWTYAADVYHGRDLDPRQSEALVGMRLGWRNQRQNIHVVIDDHGEPLTRGGATLNFGTEGSAGPVFFADDAQAQVHGHLRDGGEPAFAVRQHDGWRSVYLSMLNFPPALFRNLARLAGAHVWCDSDDVIYANRSILCLHTASPGKKVITLPAPAKLLNLWTGEKSDGPVRVLRLDSAAYRTHMWRTEYTA